MPKPKNFPEEWLDFAQAYIASAISLISNYGKDFPFDSLNNYKRSFVLSSYFLMCHGVELYLKFFIKFLGGIPPTNQHKLSKLLVEVNKLWSSYYKKPIFNLKELEIIDNLDRNFIFRYPFDKQLNLRLDMFKEAVDWNHDKATKLMNNFHQIQKS